MTTGKSTWTVYQPQVIEPKWQSAWEQAGIYASREDISRRKYYCLDYFPYPSGEGLHVGHCRNYVPTDVISRFKRMQGLNVLHPMGWDAFGEPTEQYAISHNIHPRLVTDQNTSNFRRQLRLIGTSYDWSREIDSSQPEYYRWTQYIFILLLKRGLAYRDESWQWWCPTCMTTLSSHEVSGGVCWRGHSGVVRREIPAWYFRITAYADELLSGLDEIDWPDPIKTSQRNWIGRSEGWEIDFLGEDHSRLSVFTTRPDTLFGVTFLALAPEHELVEKLTQKQYLERVRSYRELAFSQSEIERMDEKRPKTGVFTGSYLRNPVNDELIPVWIADYVLPGYGTGAVMGVPAHDQRDFEFARQFHLLVRQVIASSSEVEHSELSEAYTGYGWLVDSGQFTGMDNRSAGEAIGDILNTQGTARRTVRYRMHDWLISRQRYWGTPIPVVYCDSCGAVPVPPEQLPVLLPPIDDFQPDGTGRSPLARTEEFIRTTCPICDEPARRESDTMGGFACSSWYFLRFASPHEASAPFNSSAVEYWLPVDLYVGGAEHAVLHLLYARFWTKFLADEGLIHFREPFLHLRNQGQLLAADGQRMSKSRGNVITPDSVVSTYGADALRLYVMFIAPFDQDVSWNTDGINGARRFLNRVWTLFAEAYSASADCSRAGCRAGAKLTPDDPGGHGENR